MNVDANRFFFVVYLQNIKRNHYLILIHFNSLKEPIKAPSPPPELCGLVESAITSWLMALNYIECCQSYRQLLDF